MCLCVCGWLGDCVRVHVRVRVGVRVCARAGVVVCVCVRVRGSAGARGSAGVFSPPFAARISRVVTVRGTWRLKCERLQAGQNNGKLPPITCPDAVCHSHTRQMTGLWFLPSPAFMAEY